MFRVFIRGIGTIWVRANTAEQAREQAVQFAVNRGVGTFLEFDGDENLAVPVADNSGGFSGSGFLLDSQGGARTVTDGVIGEGVPREPERLPAPAVPKPFDPDRRAPAEFDEALRDPNILNPELASLSGTFQNFLQSQQGINPESIFGGIASQQFRPLSATFGLDQVLRNLSEIDQEEGAGSVASQIAAAGGPSGFIDFLGTMRGQGQGVSATALNALRQIGGPATGNENLFLSALQGATPGSNLGGLIQDTARQALRTRLSPAALGLFGNRAFELAGSRFNRDLSTRAGTGQVAPNFAGFLQSQLGLR